MIDYKIPPGASPVLEIAENQGAHLLEYVVHMQGRRGNLEPLGRSAGTRP